ncbi:3426_t:CDS:2 [Gigaspora margarita]|uniref:3426_t:CDS:1 n=1 Tax=Gigaspora margarita TaxID=4874 RepID=A0ABN7UQ37_GIGMA|nr:3426_t:CDS:2 [Gigaspora margarita]
MSPNFYDFDESSALANAEIDAQDFQKEFKLIGFTNTYVE